MGTPVKSLKKSYYMTHKEALLNYIYARERVGNVLLAGGPYDALWDARVRHLYKCVTAFNVVSGKLLFVSPTFRAISHYGH